MIKGIFKIVIRVQRKINCLYTDLENLRERVRKLNIQVLDIAYEKPILNYLAYYIFVKKISILLDYLSIQGLKLIREMLCFVLFILSIPLKKEQVFFFSLKRGNNERDNN